MWAFSYATYFILWKILSSFEKMLITRRCIFYYRIWIFPLITDTEHLSICTFFWCNIMWKMLLKDMREAGRVWNVHPLPCQTTKMHPMCWGKNSDAEGSESIPVSQQVNMRMITMQWAFLAKFIFVMFFIPALSRTMPARHRLAHILLVRPLNTVFFKSVHVGTYWSIPFSSAA